MSVNTLNVTADERRAPGSAGAPSSTREIGPLDVMTLEQLHARRAERLKALKAGGSPEDVAVMQDLLAELPPSHGAALRAYYLDDFSAAEAASESGLTLEKFNEVRSNARKHFNVLRGRAVRS
jgi:DNA-directed RNA polymerase specialized sigma24 family protein